MTDDKIETSQETAAPSGIQLKPGQRLLKNGAVYDHNTGRIVANNPALNPHVITKENTQRYHQMRRERYFEAAQRGVISGSGADRRDIDSAVEAIYHVQTKIATNEMAGRSSTEAARFVVSTAGLAPDRKELSKDEARDIGAGIVSELFRILQDNGHSIAENDIIDAEIVGNGRDNEGEGG